jgi:hypothetical protein
MHERPPPHIDTIHSELIRACTPAARLIGCAAWFSACVAETLERQSRDPWTLTLAELQALIDATPREPNSLRSCSRRGRQENER